MNRTTKIIFLQSPNPPIFQTIKIGKRQRKGLVLFTKVFGSLSRIGPDLFVVLLESGQVLTGLGEFSFLHTFSDVPVDEGTLGVHEVELVVDTGQRLRDGGGVGNHTDGALDLGKVTTRDVLGRLVVDTTLESSGTPVNELDGA